jgi:nucleoside-diphosphate-sugar epimerase
MKNHKYLVTGGAGFLGERIARSLLASGNSVRIFDIANSNLNTVECEYVQGDIRDPKAVSQACEQITHIIHCVSQVPLARDKKLFWTTNTDGTQRLLEAALSNGVAKFVHISTSAVFGIPDRGEVTTETVPTPVEDYGIAKLEAEKICAEYLAQGLDISIIRPRTILGPGRLGIFELLFDWVADGKRIFTFGKGENIYQFVHVDDVVSVCIRAAKVPGAGIYNIGGEPFTTMRATLQGLVDHAGTNSPISAIPMGPSVFVLKWLSKLRLLPFAPYHWLLYGRSLYFDGTYSKHKLDWKPAYGNIDAINEAYDWYLSNRTVTLESDLPSHHRRPVSRGILKILKWFL